MTEFKAFGPELVEFLVELSDNNHRDFFNTNKARYEAQVREPARAFIRAMEKRLKKISPRLLADDRKVGGSLMRVYRDTRFSKDKTPYKTNLGIQFRHDLGKDVHAPGVYLHVGLDECFLGAGMWRPDSPSLRGIRDRIQEEPEEWSASQSKRGLSKHWKLGGESLKRPPKGVDKTHPLLTDLKRKDFIMVSELTLDEVESPELCDLMISRLMPTKGFLKFLCASIEVPF